MGYSSDNSYPNQTRDVTTATASASLGGSTFTNAVIALNAKLVEGRDIKADHMQELANLMLQAAGHVHAWKDMYGKNTNKRRNDEGYSRSGSISDNEVYAIPTDFGLLYGVGQDEIVRTSHHNYSRTIHNSIRNHKHSTDEATE